MSDEDAPMELTLQGVKDVLEARGYRWHYFDVGRFARRDDRYWFNGSQFGEGPGRLARQPCGWFTLEEMLAEKFAEGYR